MDFVEAVLKDCVRVVCGTASLREELLAAGANDVQDALVFATSSKESLASTIQQLQSLDLPFADGPSGWPPAAIFKQLRDEGLVSGLIRTVSWGGPGKPIYRQV